MAQSIIPAEAAAVLADHANAIRTFGKRVISDVIEIGRRLSDAKEKAGYGNWLPWLKREFGWSHQTADRFINVFAASGKWSTLVNSDLPLSGLYLLVAPSTPEEARAEVTARVESGESLSVADVVSTVNEVKRQTTGRGTQRPRKGLKRTAADIKAADRAEQTSAAKQTSLVPQTLAEAVKQLAEVDAVEAVRWMTTDERSALMAEIMRVADKKVIDIATVGGAMFGKLAPVNVRFEALEFLRKAIAKIDGELSKQAAEGSA